LEFGNGGVVESQGLKLRWGYNFNTGISF
jgi:hypothetical protein